MTEIVAATDNFAVHREIGTGSFGRVFSATLPCGRQVAVKRMHRDGGCSRDTLLTSFYTELEAARDVGNHPHVVQIVGQVWPASKCPPPETS